MTTCGQIGFKKFKIVRNPTLIKGLKNIVQISAGVNFTIALDSNGLVWGWGGNYHGRLGRSDKNIYTKPFQLSNLNNIVQITTLNYGGLALTNKGTVWRWGASNIFERFGSPSELQFKDIVSISSGAITVLH